MVLQRSFSKAIKMQLSQVLVRVGGSVTERLQQCFDMPACMCILALLVASFQYCLVSKNVSLDSERG